MGTRIIWAVIVFALAAALTIPQALRDSARDNAAAAAEPPAAMQADEGGQEFAASSNALGFKLLTALHREEKTNVIFSPLSVQLALAMTLNGAAGGTAQQMRAAMSLGARPLSEVNMSARWLLTALAEADPQVEMSLADSLWLQRGMSLDEDFAKQCRDNYGAEVTETNLTSRFALKQMDDWVKAQTNGRIKSIIDPPVDDATVLILLNAIYFKSAWEKPFDKEDTRDDEFTLSTGETIPVKMMRQSSGWQYNETGDFKAVRMGYGDSGRLGMYVFLPSEKLGISGLLARLTPEKWDEWTGGFYGMEGLVGLPRFKAEYGVKLNDPLKALGMRDAFDPSRAQFPNMVNAGNPVFIGLVKHKAFMDVNEAGTEAAAATAVHGWTTAAPGEEPKTFTMIVRRPFLLAITDEDTGAILFLGAVERPEGE
jgi:serine protease inhibitor